MGSGSSAEVDAHLRKWESAVNDLQTLCSSHRRVLDSDRTVSPSGEGDRNAEKLPGSGGNSTSGGNSNTKGGQSSGEEGNESERSLRRRASSLVSFGAKVPGQSAPAEPAASATPRSSNNFFVEPTVDAHTKSPQRMSESTMSNTTKHHSRQQVLELRKKRNAILKTYECAEGVDFENIEGALNCNHFAAVALALSSLLGGGKDNNDRRTRVTVEDLFFAAQVPLHMLHAAPPPLTVMNDIIREFMDVDNRFKTQYYVECVHLDVAPTIGQVELGANDVGDRQCKVQLSEFRKQVSHDIDEEADVIRIVNYDPFILEQGMMVESDESASSPVAPVAATFSTGAFGLNPAAQAKFQPQNDGAFAVVIDARNAVQPMVTLAEGVMSDQLYARITEVPSNQLFKAMMNAEDGHRAKGYIRIGKREARTLSNSNTEKTNPVTQDDVQLFFTPELCSGKVLGTNVDGSNAAAIPQFVSPHITACSWAMHLICGVRPNTHGHGKGLPVSEIIRTLRLPADVLVNSELSLDQVYLYFQEYLKQKLLDRNVTLGLYPVLTKISREDAVPTISVFDLESILIDVKSANEDPESPQHVMIIQYNANVAHNVLGIASLPQWCVLVGYDDDTQTARLIDANAKTFSQSWTCPLDRLHKSMTGYGYIMVSRPTERKSSAPSSQPESRSSTPGSTLNPFGVGSLRQIASTVQSRLDLIKEQQHNNNAHTALPARLRVYSLPTRPFAVTTLALALHQLTGVVASFDDFVHRLPYDVNAVLAEHLPLECSKICVDRMIEVMGFDGQVTTKVHHFDRHTTGKLTYPIKQFAALLNAHAPSDDRKVSLADHVMVVSFDRSLIQVHGTTHPYGSTAIVTHFAEEESCVTLLDANPNVYLRQWTVPLETLHRSMQNVAGGGHRLHGAVILSKIAAVAKSANKNVTQRNFELSLLPVQNLFHVSPSPQIQGLSLSFAQLGYFFTPEEIFYEAYLKTVSDQRRRGSQAFAWRDVEVSLAIVNKKIDARLITLVSKKFIESRKLSGVVVEQVDDIDIDELPDIIAAATTSKDSVLLVNYNTQAIHGLSNLGSSVALIQAYDRDTETVTLVDAEYTVFGWKWTATLGQLIEAADLDNDGSTPYGFVRITQTSSTTAAPTSGLGGDPDREECEPSTESVDNNSNQRKVRGSTKFVDE